MSNAPGSFIWYELMTTDAAPKFYGGAVTMGPHEVPGGDCVVVATDPQGAPFGVVGPQGT